MLFEDDSIKTIGQINNCIQHFLWKLPRLDIETSEELIFFRKKGIGDSQFHQFADGSGPKRGYPGDLGGGLLLYWILIAFLAKHENIQVFCIKPYSSSIYYEVCKSISTKSALSNLSWTDQLYFIIL